MSKMEITKASISIPFDVYINKCECGSEFILLAYFEGDDESPTRFLHQSNPYYCPYCDFKTS